MTQLSRRLRMAVFERDNHRCVYCGAGPEAMLEADHVVARANGGSDEPGNLVTACRACNGGKSAHEVPLPDPLVLARPMPAWWTDRRPTPTRRLSSGFRGSRSYPACDLCGEPSNTVHWTPYLPLNFEDPRDDLPHRDCQVLFACPDHDPSGYWLYTKDLDTGPRDWTDASRLYTGRRHVRDKRSGFYAIALLDDRAAGHPARIVSTVHWRSGDDVVAIWHPKPPVEPTVEYR